MDAELKAKWVTALRSGKYKQGKHRLNRYNTFCCLGVLCEVLELPKRLCVAEDQFHTMEYREYRCDGRDDDGGWTSGVLPEGVYQLLGFSSPTVIVGSDEYGNRTLAIENDVGKTFEQIADIIEAQL